MLKIQEDILLNKFTTFQIGGPASYFTVVKDEVDLREAFSFAKSRRLPIFILGGGSNVLISDNGFQGLVIKNEIKGVKFIDKNNDKVILEVGAGEIWDDVAALSSIRKLFGLENLSGIPGTVGGAAVQNAGAYGTEFSDHLISIQGLNITNSKKFVLKKADCQYGYRDSFFKKNKKYVITVITLELNKKPIFNIEYTGLKNKLGKQKDISAELIRKVVLDIRAEKLPDWHKLGTAGSFFKNPIITQAKFDELKERYPEMPGFPEPRREIKVPLAWILDKVCNLRGFKEGKVGLYEKQPIILVNFGKATEKEIFDFALKIKSLVKDQIGINIECEVERIN